MTNRIARASGGDAVKSREEKARYEGANWVLEKIERDGLEAVKEEMKYRNVRMFPLHVDMAEVHRFEQETKRRVLKTVSCMALMVLRDEFGFGHDRLEKYVKRFNVKTACLNEDLTTWPDFAQTLREEVGIDVDPEHEFEE